jgi:hypothetical protein
VASVLVLRLLSGVFTSALLRRAVTSGAGQSEGQVNGARLVAV